MNLSFYLMESPDEGQRLEHKTKLPDTRRQLELVGVKPEMAVLDAGAGTGAVSRLIAEMVGSKGNVVALDISQTRLAEGQKLATGSPNLSFVEGDIYEAPLEDESFDLVWSRFVFQYLARPQEALNRLTKLVKVGGKIVVADLDGNGTIHFPISEEMTQALFTLQRLLKGTFDPFMGRKLFHFFRDQRLSSITTHILPYHHYAGAADEEALRNWSQKFATIRPRALQAFSSERAYDRFVDEFMGMLRSPDVFTYSVLIVAEGIRTE